jgi:hypothetical protein
VTGAKAGTWGGNPRRERYVIDASAVCQPNGANYYVRLQPAIRIGEQNPFSSRGFRTNVAGVALA